MNEKVRNEMTKLLMLGLLMLGSISITFGATNPGYGYYTYGRLQSELILPHDLAKDLATNLNSNTNDAVTQGLIRKLVTQSANWGGRAIPWVSASNLVVNLALSASRLQMKLATDIPNYEAYGFKMVGGVPYHVVQYSWRDYTLLKEKNSQAVYVVIGDAKFWVPNGSYFNYDWTRIQPVDDGRLNNWWPYPSRGTLLKEVSSPEVWVVYMGLRDPAYTWVSYPNNQLHWVRRHVMSYDAILRMRKTWNDVRVVPDGSFSSPNPYLPRGFDWY